MGCGCKKKSGGVVSGANLNTQMPKFRLNTPGITIHYVYCPSCKVVKAMRISEDELVGKTCENCNTPIVYFKYPPSQQKLKWAAEQRGFNANSGTTSGQ